MSARTQSWWLTIDSIDVLALGAAGGFIWVTLQNAISKKSRRGYFKVGGGGIGVDIKTLLKSAQQARPGEPIGEVSIFTDETMGFDDFDSQVIRLEFVKAALGLSSTYGTLTLVGLGAGAENRVFKHSFSLSLKPDLRLLSCQDHLHSRATIRAIGTR